MLRTRVGLRAPHDGRRTTTRAVPLGYRPGVGYDPYRDEVRRMLLPLVVGAALVAGLVLHALVRPHLGAMASLALAVAGGIGVEVLLLLITKRRRARSSARS